MKAPNTLPRKTYFLHSIKVGTLAWARPFPADAFSTSHANKGPASSALPWPMAYQPWALAELTRRRLNMLTAKFLARQRRHAKANDFPENFRKKTGNSWKSKSAQNHLKYVLDQKKIFSPSGQNVLWDFVSAAPITSQRLSPHPEGQKNFFLSQIYFGSFWTVFENLSFFCHFCGKFCAKSFYFGVWRRRKNYASLIWAINHHCKFCATSYVRIGRSEHCGKKFRHV